jgi:NAD+ synthase (glutamine-hydrolysing)
MLPPAEVRSLVLSHVERVIVDTCRLDEIVIADARRIVGEPADSDYLPTDHKEFCRRIFHTCYMGTENSSFETRMRAKHLAEAIGRSNSPPSILSRDLQSLVNFASSYHIDLNMDTLVTAVRNLFSVVTGVTPQFRAHGGSSAENLALQNIQVRRSLVCGKMSLSCLILVE